jgi:hypothetical protein
MEIAGSAFQADAPSAAMMMGRTWVNEIPARVISKT